MTIIIEIFWQVAAFNISTDQKLLSQFVSILDAESK